MPRTITIIHDAAGYRAALAEYETYFDNEPAPGSDEGDRFVLLGMVIARYEAEQAPIPDADPVDVLRFVMDSNGRSQRDLAELLGSRSRASELLNRRRDFTLDQIRKLTREWRIPADALLGELTAA